MILRASPHICGTNANDIRVGTPASEIFYASNGNDKLIGGGGADAIYGGSGSDTIQISDLDFFRVDGGYDGFRESDTLSLDGSGMNLNLMDVRNRIVNIEIIDLSGTGDNILTLTAENILFFPGINPLIIKGNTGDQVVGLSSGWVDRGFQGEFHMFSTQDKAVLMVADAVSTDFVNGGHMNLSDLDGVAAGDYSDGSVSNAGDVNGDGFDDVIIGASGADPNADFRDEGSSYVVFGKAAGFDATMSLSGLDGSNGFRMKGGAYDNLGGSTSTAGNVNGGGFDDVIISTRGIRVGDYYSGYTDTRGGSYVVFGKASGFDAEMNLSELDGSNGFRLNEEGDYSSVLVSGAGDVNGDGFDDVIIADPEQDRFGNTVGPSSSYVMFGKASGFSAVADLSGLAGHEGFRLDGAADILVTSVNGAGDVNGDGFDDLIAGASRADLNGGDSGSSFVIFCRSDFTGGPDFLATPGDDVFTGTKAAERFEARVGNDKMIGRSGADVFYGEAGDDYIRVADLNFQLVDGGDGRDTLGLSGSGQNLDLASVQDRISDIETIYLYGTGDNTLTLTALDVVNLSSTSNVLRVNGNEGDHIVGLSSGWNDGGVHGKFHTYTQGDAVLPVGINVATDFV